MLVEKCIDGFVKITIPELEIVTYASDLEDAQVAIAEALEAHRVMVNQFASISEKKDYNKLVNSKKFISLRDKIQSYGLYNSNSR
jgi:hypothetical protein